MVLMVEMSTTKNLPPTSEEQMVNPKKAAVSQAAPASKYKVSAQMEEAIQKVEELLAKRKTIDAKIEAGLVEAKAAEAPYEAALEAEAQACANLALAIEEKDYLACEKAVEAAAEAVQVAHRKKILSARTVEALCNMAVTTDREIEVAKVDVDLEQGILAGEVVDAFAIELDEAIKPLLTVLAQAQALHVAVRSPGLINFMNGLVIPDPRDQSGRTHLVGDGFVTRNGRRESVSAAMQEEPSAQAVAAALQPIVHVRAKLLSHRPFVHPSKRPAPYVVKGRSDGPSGPLSEALARAHVHASSQ
jgi:hypothetical protein